MVCECGMSGGVMVVGGGVSGGVSGVVEERNQKVKLLGYSYSCDAAVQV